MTHISRHKKTFVILAIAASMVISCTVQEVFGPLDTKYGSDAFSLDEAKEFFEKDYATVSTKADAETKKPFRRLSPGEFTPLWENAQYSIRGDIAAFDVPVIAEKRIRAIRSRFGTDGAKAKIVNAYQKLVVVKNCSNGNYGAYILTLVPDIGHDTGGSILQKFISRTENRGNFSGIAIYTQPGSNAIIRIDEYRNGKKYRGVFLPKGTDTLEKRLRKAAILMKGICFGSSASPLTRAGEDWEWWDEDDDEWWDNFWDEWYAENGQIYDNIDNGNDDSWTFSGYKDIGDGYFMDNDGDIYFDSDGDGNPDSFVINDSTCESGDDSSTEKKEEEKPEDPEPPEKPEGDNWEECGMDDDPDEKNEPVNGNNNESDDSEEQKMIDEKSSILVKILGKEIENIKNHITFKVGSPEQQTLTSSKMTLRAVFDPDADIEFIVKGGLNAIQIELILGHEFMHIILLEISRNAGSSSELGRSNPELLIAINMANQDVNAGHHNYMGNHIDELEEMLRNAFPGRDEKFYEYGKWGGGAFDSDAFDKLSDKEQRAIIRYLKKNDLHEK